MRSRKLFGSGSPVSVPHSSDRPISSALGINRCPTQTHWGPQDIIHFLQNITLPCILRRLKQTCENLNPKGRNTSGRLSKISEIICVDSSRLLGISKIFIESRSNCFAVVKITFGIRLIGLTLDLAFTIWVTLSKILNICVPQFSVKWV